MLEEDEESEIFNAICLEQNIKYKFIITDSFGDGICCAEGEGSYTVTLEDKVVKRGGNFSSFEEVDFKFTLSEDLCEDNNPSTYFVFDPDIKACLYYPVSCSIYGAMVIVVIKSDIYADDTIWNVQGNGTVEMEGGMYTLAYTDYVTEKCLPYGSYIFTIIDPPADGMAFCFDNDCGYELIVNNVAIEQSDGSFSVTTSHVFGICTSDDQCNDFDECTNDICDVERKICFYNKLSCSECSKQTVVVDVFTDVLFSLTSWNIVEKRQNISVASAGPFVKSYTHYQKTTCVSTGYYQFTVTNSEGRGMTICKNNLECGYSVIVNNHTILTNDGSFEYEKKHTFIICDYDSDCQNNDSCSVGNCDNETKLCQFEKLPCSSCDKKDLKVIINTDGNATETSWNLVKKNDGSIITTGGKYARDYTEYIHDECILEGEYIYTIFDERGNGLTSCFDEKKNCTYIVAVDNKVIIESMGDFSYQLSYAFKLCNEDSNCNEVISSFIPTTNPTFAPISSYFQFLKIESFAVGFYHTCALSDKGLIFCFGSNDFGQLGYGDTVHRHEIRENFPSVDIGESNRAKEIYAGAFHTCVLLEKNDLICWGSNVDGQLGIGSTTNIGSSIGQMGNALKMVDLGLGRKVKRISLGYRHTCAILDDDILKCWGSNKFGELGYGVTEAIGDNEAEMGDKLGLIDLGDDGIVQDVSAGIHHTCVLQASQLKCFGKNSNSQLGYGDKVNRGNSEESMGNKLPFVNIGGTPVRVSTGNSVTCVVLDTGNSKCFGYNKFAQLGYGDKLERGGNENMGDLLPVLDIGDHFNITQITRGSYSTCALTSNSSVKCWGNNLECSLGLGDRKNRVDGYDMGNNLPFIDFGGKKVNDIKMFHWHACVLFDDNTLFCWGFNRYGQLGQGHHKSVGCNALEMGNNIASVPIVEAEKWKIQFNRMHFDQGHSNKLLEYHVSRNIIKGQFIARIFDETCSKESNETSMAIRTNLLGTSNNIYQQGIVILETNYSSMLTSNIWTSTSNSTGYFNFCIRADLLLSNESELSVSFVETFVSMDLNLNTKILSPGVGDISLQSNQVQEVNQDQELGVKACICDEVLDCIVHPHLAPNSEISLCVVPLENNIEVEEFISVGLYQDGVLKFSPVSNSQNVELTTTYAGPTGVMRTRMLSTFFDEDIPSDLYISGRILLKLHETRSLREVELDDLKRKSKRKASFRLRVSLAKTNRLYYKAISGLALIFLSISLGFYKKKKKSYGYIILSTSEN